MHLGQLAVIRPGEQKYITPDLIKMGTLTGTGPKTIDRIRELEAVGVTNIALNVCGRETLHIGRVSLVLLMRRQAGDGGCVRRDSKIPRGAVC